MRNDQLPLPKTARKEKKKEARERKARRTKAKESMAASLPEDPPTAKIKEKTT